MLLSLILCHVKEEAEANKMTKEEQIGRLLRPGYTYRLALCLFLFVYLYLYLYLLRNLNPFEVLQIDPEASVDDAKKKFRRMSIMVGKHIHDFQD